MTAEWFDLGQRLYAASVRRPVARLSGAPFENVTHPVAVRASVHGGTVTASLAVPSGRVQTVRGRAVLSALGRHGVSMASDNWRTLVTDDRATLGVLAELARTVKPAEADSDVAAHIGWWAARSDFPGTSAVVDVVAASRQRWVIGEPSHAEKLAATWRSWLGVADDSTAGVLALFDLLIEGEPINGIGSIRADDAFEWAAARSEHNDGRDWRHTDPVGRAAVGLSARCNAAEVYESALLADPLYRRRAFHTGHVVTGTLHRVESRTITVTCERLDARLRPQNSVVGWAGVADTTTLGRFAGTVKETETVAGRLVLHMTVSLTHLPADGVTVSLMVSPARESAIRDGKSRYSRLYATHSSWLTTGRTPTPARRDVPLEVLVAAADE